MRVALCHPDVTPGKGGCETYIVDLARWLIRDGHDVHLLAWRYDERALPAEVQSVRLPGPRETCWRMRRPWLFSAACLRAQRRLPPHVSIGFDKTWGQDVLYPQGGLHAACLRQNLMIPRGPAGRLLARARQMLDPALWSFARLERRQYLQTRSLVIVNSRMVRSHFQEQFNLGLERFHVIPNAIDADRLHDPDPEATRRRERHALGIPMDESIGLFAAMNYELKGLAPLLQAMRRMPEQHRFHLVVTGNPRNGAYRSLARRLGVHSRVHFLGYRADMRGCYLASDFLVHPTFYDPCSLVALEAMACGLPVITTRHNGAAELFQAPQEGLVIDDPHDEEALSAALTRMLDLEFRTRCAAGARRAANRWTRENHFQRILQVLREAGRQRQAA